MIKIVYTVLFHNIFCYIIITFTLHFISSFTKKKDNFLNFSINVEYFIKSRLYDILDLLIVVM